MRRTGTLGGQRERAWILGGGLVGQADDLVNLVAREVRSDAEVRIADHVEVR